MARRNKRKRTPPSVPSGPLHPNSEAKPGTQTDASSKSNDSPPLVSPQQFDLSSVAQLLEKQTKAIEDLGAKKAKDVWDKLPVFATLFSTGLIATVGLVFTITYQRSEIRNREMLREQEARQEEHRARVQELELVVKLLPSLSSKNENDKKHAYLTLKALGNTELMSKLALDDAGSGAKAALFAVATSPLATDADRKIASQALEQLRQWDDAIIKQAFKSLVEVRPEDGKRGAGFLWPEPNHVVTSLRIVAGSKSISVVEKTHPWLSHAAKVDRILRKADLVLLKMTTTPNTPAFQIDEKVPAAGERALLLQSMDGSYPQTSWILLRPLALTNLRDLLPDGVQTEIKKIGFPSLDQKALSLDGIPQTRYSGHPLVNMDGKVVGIVGGQVPKDDDLYLTWVYPVSELQELLKSTEPLLSQAELSQFK
jgi:S1-C subfamily serine protease